MPQPTRTAYDEFAPDALSDSRRVKPPRHEYNNGHRDDNQPRTRRPRPTADSHGPRRSAKRRPEPEKPNYNFISFLRDPRTHLGFGIFLCITAIVMMATCISFMANGTIDQSVIHGRTPEEIKAAGDSVQTAGGIIGAKLAEWLLIDTFGVASFVLAIYIFTVGLACMHLRRCSFFSLTFRSLFTTVALSVILGLASFNSDSLFYLGGMHGHNVNVLVSEYADFLGIYALSALLGGLLIAVYFYPLRNMCMAIVRAIPKRKPKPKADETQAPQETADEATSTPLDAFETQPVPEDSDEDASSEADKPISALESFKSDSYTEPADPTDILNQLEAETLGIVKPKKETAEAKEPEMVIVNNKLGDSTNDATNDNDNDNEPETDNIVDNAATESSPEVPMTIRHGDHIGLDQPYDVRAAHANYQFPPIDLLEERPNTFTIDENEQKANKDLIVSTLASYNIEIVRIEAVIGPTVTLYEIVPSQGTRISKIKSLEDDIAMSLAALGIRIIAPIPGKGTIGIEVPNSKPQTVSMRTIIESRKFQTTKMNLPLVLGATISNEIFMTDLTKMPHLLVAGATGQGKSVGLNCIITSLLYSKHPDELKFVLVDPKMVEFSLYSVIEPQYLAKIPGEDSAVITDVSKVVATLNSLCTEMDQRYELLRASRVRTLEEYNQRVKSRQLNPAEGFRYLPYIVVIVDEYADLVMTAGKEIPQPICRLAQKARAVGIHLIIATQRPSTDIITGMIKANFPARIAFKVTQSVDSKTILDRPGAQRLIGRGDMLIMDRGVVERVQCAFVDTPEIEAICKHVSEQPGFTEAYELPEPPSEESADITAADIQISDEFRNCCMFVASQDNGSVSSLQTKFGIGFVKAKRYMEQMQQIGIVGPSKGAKPREVLMTPDDVERLLS